MALKSAALFEQMTPFLKTNGVDLVKKVNAVFFFEIAKSKGAEVTTWTIDLKNGTGVEIQITNFLIKALHTGRVGTADATFSLLDDDLIAMANGTLNPQ